MSSRSYASPVRDAAKQQTRETILKALVQVVLDDGVHAFTMQNVARKAGVALRTVYRHFDTREALLDGLSVDLVARLAGAGLPSHPPDVNFLKERFEAGLRKMGQAQDWVRAYVIVSVALGRQVPDSVERTEAFRAVLLRAFPSLPAGEIDEATAMIRHIASSRTWFALTAEQHLDHATAARAAAWAMRTLLEDLERREASAKARSPS